MDITAFYVSIGGDYGDARKRFARDDIIRRFVRMFPTDPSFLELKTALEEDRTQAAFQAAHSLKGVSANLSFARLAASASALTELLRGQTQMPEAAGPLFDRLAADYEQVIRGIAQLEE